MNAREKERERVERNKKLRFLFICSIHNKKRTTIHHMERGGVGDGSVGE